jgi:hypothetical protein
MFVRRAGKGVGARRAIGLVGIAIDVQPVRFLAGRRVDIL